MALTIIDFKACFNLSQTPKQFNFTDTTDYTGQAVALTDVVGIFKIVDPTGTTVYNNTTFGSPDIDPDVALTNSTTISIPLLSGVPIPGIYTITYTVQFDDGINPVFTVVRTKTFEYKHVSPRVVITQIVDCISPLFTSRDDTNYIVNGVTPAISRLHQVFFPPALDPPISPLTGIAAVLTTNTFFTETHSTLIKSGLVYSIAADYCVIDEVSGSKEVDINCDPLLCDIFCCVNTLFEKFKDKQKVNKVFAEQLLEKLTRVCCLMTLVKQAIDCGRADTANSIIADILDIAGCEPGCGCEGDVPQQVMGLGGGANNIIVDTCGNGILVSSLTVGNTTTYTVCLDTALVNKINNAFNTKVIAGTGINVTEVTLINGDKEFTVDFIGLLTPVPQSLYFIAEIDYSLLIPSITILGEEINGDAPNLFQSPTVAEVNSFNINKNNQFEVSGFMVTPSSVFKVQAELIPVSVDGKAVGGLISGAGFAEGARLFQIEIYAQGSGVFRFRLLNGGGINIMSNDAPGKPLTNNKIKLQNAIIRAHINIFE